jgi:hypothetical protein
MNRGTFKDVSARTVLSRLANVEHEQVLARPRRYLRAFTLWLLNGDNRPTVQVYTDARDASL